MKKLIITLAIALAACTAAFAQKGLSVGAGYLTNSVSTAITVGSTTTTSVQAYDGFYAGLSYNVLTLGPGINIVPGLYFASASYNKENTLTTDKGSESYLAVPINISYKIELVPGTLAIEPYVGPTCAYGLSSKWSSTAGSVTVEGDNYGDNSKYGKFDLQVGAGLAIDIVDMIRVSVGYNYGLLDRHSADDTKIHTSNINFGVAYLF